MPGGRSGRLRSTQPRSVVCLSDPGARPAHTAPAPPFLGCYWLPTRTSYSLARLEEEGEDVVMTSQSSLVPLPINHEVAGGSGSSSDMADGGGWRPPRPCEAYRAEWELCCSAGHFLRHYYVHGERPACGQWRRDLASCREWEERRSAEAQRSLCESERARVRAAQKHGLVWTPRQSPPADWHLPLPQDKDS